MRKSPYKSNLKFATVTCSGKLGNLGLERDLFSNNS